MRLNRFFRYAAAGIVVGGFAYHEVKSDVPTSPQGAPDEIGDLIRTLPKTDMAFPSMPVLADDGSRVDLKQSNFLQFGEAAEPLYGQVAFCDRLPKECDHRSDYQEAVMLDSKTFDDFMETNQFANTMITPANDIDKYKSSDYWAIPQYENGKGMEGDCEDYVLFKIKELEKIGVPHSAMSIVYVQTPEKEGHAILGVRTNKGDILFDNLTNALLYPQETNYRFIRATSLTNERKWQKLADVVHQVSGKGAREQAPPQTQNP